MDLIFDCRRICSRAHIVRALARHVGEQRVEAQIRRLNDHLANRRGLRRTNGASVAQTGAVSRVRSNIVAASI